MNQTFKNIYGGKIMNIKAIVLTTITLLALATSIAQADTSVLKGLSLSEREVILKFLYPDELAGNQAKVCPSDYAVVLVVGTGATSVTMAAATFKSLGLYSATHATAGATIIGTTSAGFLAGTVGTAGAAAVSIVSTPFVVGTAVAAVAVLAGAETLCHYRF